MAKHKKVMDIYKYKLNNKSHNDLIYIKKGNDKNE